MNTIQQEIPSEVFDRLLGLWQGETSLISPITAYLPDLPADIQQQLQEYGWLQPDGQPNAILLSLLLPLAQTTRALTLMLGTDEEHRSYTLYEAPEAQSQVGVFQEKEGTLELRMPVPQDEIPRMLRARFGGGLSLDVPLAQELSAGDALALAALLDLQRLVTISSTTLDHSAAPGAPGWSEETLLRALQRGEDAEPAFWVISLTLETLVNKDKWEPAEVKAALANLSAARLVEPAADGYALRGAMLQTAQLLAAPVGMISLSLQSIIEENGIADIQEEEALGLCVQGAVVLFSRTHAGGVCLHTLAGDEMTTALESILFSQSAQPTGLRQVLPAAAPAPISPVADGMDASIPAPVPTHCPKCSNPLKPGIQFCGSCGTPVQAAAPAPQPKFCPQCGTARKPGKSFCGACGCKFSD